MNTKFGDIGRLTKRQTNRRHFSKIPVGELFMILNEVDLPGYDAVAIFPNFQPQILDNNERSYTGYLERKSYEIIGDIFTNVNLLKPDHHLYLKEIKDYTKNN